MIYICAGWVDGESDKHECGAIIRVEGWEDNIISHGICPYCLALWEWDFRSDRCDPKEGQKR